MNISLSIPIPENLLKLRSGPVLSRQMILKTDHFYTGINNNLDHLILGAPNFRGSDLNIYGVAQPAVHGLHTILHVLRCSPWTRTESSTKCIWISTREEPLIYVNDRPFVLRDESSPFTNIHFYSGIRPTRLESMEERLKEDILSEGKRSNGLIVVHDEREEGKLAPCLVAIDRVQTPREVYDSLRKEGYHVEYHRIPVSPEQSPSEEYLDSVIDIIRRVNISHPIVFNCGMGLGRTTHAMILGLLIKRHLLLESDNTSKDPLSKIIHQIPHINSQIERRDLLKLVFVLEQGLKRSSYSAIEWALERSSLLDSLHAAIKGNYHIINRLCSALRMGYEVKRLVDDAIDKCSLLLNIRDNILTQRVRYFVSTESNALQTGLTSLERYFSLIVFASFLESIRSKDEFYCFSKWIKERTEIWGMFQFVRTSMNKIQLFRPIDDLSAFVLHHDKNMVLTSHMIDISKTNGMNDSLAEEYTKNRSGSVLGPCMILKIDQWYAVSAQHSSMIENHSFSVPGAFHFRKMQGLPIYGVAQPTRDGIETILNTILNEVNAASFSVSTLSLNEQDMITSAFHHSTICPSLIWLNLREEPIVYIRGIPFVLRDQYATLRNIKSYSGISSERLEALEDRLVEDIKCEIHACEGSLLLHEEEIQTGKIIPKWEEISMNDVMTVRQLYEKSINPIWESLSYYRIPITAEEAPEFSEFDSIFNILSLNNGPSSNVVINCQMGAGRSSMGMVICAMILNRLEELEERKYSIEKKGNEQSTDDTSSSMFEYHVIRSLLRVIRQGIRTKAKVDELIDTASLPMNRNNPSITNNDSNENEDEPLNNNNLRDSIECYRRLAESFTDLNSKQRAIKKGLHQLKRYFLLIAFQSWLFQLENIDDNMEPFSTWIQKRPELLHMIKTLDISPPSLDPLIPEMHHQRKPLLFTEDHQPMIKRMDTNPEFVRFVLNRRNDSVLASQMILKSDHFPGCHISKLPYKVDGAPNYRELLLYYSDEEKIFFGGYMDLIAIAERIFKKEKVKKKKYIYGMAVPSVPALCNLIKNVLSVRKEVVPSNRCIIWTSLREEPVLYINGLPYVLRTLSMPWSNLEATGIARERVESMEVKMKQGALRELSRYDGNLLLHEEIIAQDDKPVLVPFWEKVSDNQVLTPHDVYFHIAQDGYDVDYLRLPITDEQAPIPLIFDMLYERYFNTDIKCDYLFNCQMGRGRTTTAMIASCLIEVICHGAKMNEPVPGYIENNLLGKNKVYYHHAYLEKDNELNDDTENMNRYLCGEYKIILQLVQILEYGLVAKRVADICIDVCDHIQNLREAIYEYKIRMDHQKKPSIGSYEQAEPRTILYSSLFKRGLNYLVRYFYLIVFANYLMDTCHHSPAAPIKYFSSWLDERKEIVYLSTLPNIDLS